MAVQIEKTLLERLGEQPLENLRNENPATWGQLWQFDVERIKRRYLSGTDALDLWIQTHKINAALSDEPGLIGSTTLRADHPLLEIVADLKPDIKPLVTRELPRNMECWVTLSGFDNGRIVATVMDVKTDRTFNGKAWETKTHPPEFRMMVACRDVPRT